MDTKDIIKEVLGLAPFLIIALGLCLIGWVGGMPND